MKVFSFVRIPRSALPLVIGAVSIVGVGLADDMLKTNATNVGLPKTARFNDISERWAQVPMEEIRQAAEKGIADAQLYYGVMEWKAANRENSSATLSDLAPAKDNEASEKENQESQ